MLRNPSLYGITHDEIEKDPLLEQVLNYALVRSQLLLIELLCIPPTFLVVYFIIAGDVFWNPPLSAAVSSWERTGHYKVSSTLCTSCLMSGLLSTFLHYFPCGDISSNLFVFFPCSEERISFTQLPHCWTKTILLNMTRNQETSRLVHSYANFFSSFPVSSIYQFYLGELAPDIL